MSLRPCLVNGKKALFHSWIEIRDVIFPSLMINGTQGGQIANTFALVEYENGKISLEEVTSIKFLDNVFKDYNFKEIEEEV